MKVFGGLHNFVEAYKDGCNQIYANVLQMSMIEMNGKRLATKSEARAFVNMTESTFDRRVNEGAFIEYRAGNSQPYFDLDQIANAFKPTIKAKAE